MEIKTGGATKSSRIELELLLIIYILLFFVVIFLFKMLRLYITSNVHQSSFISHHINRRGGDDAMFRVSKDTNGANLVRTICDDFHQAKGTV